MRSPAHRNYRAGEPSRARSAGARPRRAHTNSCSGSRTPQADVAGGASRAHWYITVRSQIGASFSSFSGYRAGFASSLRGASLFYHTWQHERSFVWAWSASCGTNRSFKAFVKFLRKRLAAPPHVTSTRGCNGTDTSTLRIIAPTSPPARLISARSRRPTTTRRRRCASISSAPSAPASRRSSR